MFRHEWLYIVWFHLQQLNRENKSVKIGSWGMEMGTGINCKGKSSDGSWECFFFFLIDCCYICIIVKFTTNYWIVHLKGGKFMLCKLCLNETIK